MLEVTKEYRELFWFLFPYVILSVLGFNVRILNRPADPKHTISLKTALQRVLVGTITAAFSGIVIGLFVYQAKPVAFPGWAAAGIAGWCGGTIVDRLVAKIFGKLDDIEEVAWKEESK